MVELAIFLLTIVLALAYAYSNGINDAANAIATVISTRAMTPRAAVAMGAIMNLLGALTGTAVAKTIGKGIIDPGGITEYTVIAAIAASIIWVLFATRLGLPVSVSHSLVASVVGAGLATGGPGVVNPGGFTKVLLALAFSPILGFAAAFIVMVLLYNLVRRMGPGTVNSIFWRLQVISGALLAYSHGKNDGQNAMGIMALAAALYYSQEVTIDLWMILAGALAIGLGTALGGYRVIRTLGLRITKLETIHGFAASASAAGVIEAASSIGLPVSTTHTMSTAIMGVGATRRFSAVRWGVTRSIALAWVVTYPICFVLAWVLSRALGVFA